MSKVKIDLQQRLADFFARTMTSKDAILMKDVWAYAKSLERNQSASVNVLLRGYDDMIEMLHNLAVMAGMEPDEDGNLERGDYYGVIEQAIKKDKT